MIPADPTPKLKVTKTQLLSAFLQPSSRKSSLVADTGAGRDGADGGGGGGTSLTAHSRTASASGNIIADYKQSKKANSRPSSRPSSRPASSHRANQPGHPTTNHARQTSQPLLRTPDWRQQQPLTDALGLVPPPAITDDGVYYQTATPPDSPHLSATGRSTPGSPRLGPGRGSPDPLDLKNKKRRSLLPGSNRKLSKTHPEMAAGPSPKAWIAGVERTFSEYDLNNLISGGRVDELWEDGGDTFIYLFPKSSARGPSFRLFSASFASSDVLTKLAHTNVPVDDARPSSRVPSVDLGVQELNQRVPSLSLTNDGSAPAEKSDHIHLYVPISHSADMSFAPRDGMQVKASDEDLDQLVGARNLFSFLVGQSLVCTERRPTTFSVFTQIADLLSAYGFSNIDGSTRGEVAASSFDEYVSELSLADVRGQREKSIEGVFLAESMRSSLLYNETFVHAVGQYQGIRDLLKQSEVFRLKFDSLSEKSRARMERAAIDLENREIAVKLKLEEFGFHGLFTGLMSSKTAKEGKMLHLNAWKQSFEATRKHVLSYYKQQYGSWPPKASSKKNDLETGGLNRLVLKQVYDDFAQCYDLYVDQNTPTTRGHDPEWHQRSKTTTNPFELAPHVLRRIFDEYDRASPPVQPPIPFDTPLLPTLGTPQEKGELNKVIKNMSKKLSFDDVNVALSNCVNTSVLNVVKNFPFVASLRDFERKEASGKSLMQLLEHRAGMWMFIYAVMQSLPLLAVDAPGLRYHEGVEYFLCEVPRGPLPWVRSRLPGHESPSSSNLLAANSNNEGGIVLNEAARILSSKRSWYGVNGGFVQLPSDLIDHGVEGVYRRSHCWIRAGEWTGNLETAARIRRRNSIERQNRRSQDTPSIHSSAGGVASATPSVSGHSRSDSPPGMQRSPPVVEGVPGMGLQALPIPEGVGVGLMGETIPIAPPKRPSSRDGRRLETPSALQSQARSRSAGRYPSNGRIEGKPTTTTFDDILGKRNIWGASNTSATTKKKGRKVFG